MSPGIGGLQLTGHPEAASTAKAPVSILVGSILQLGMGSVTWETQMTRIVDSGSLLAGTHLQDVA